MKYQLLLSATISILLANVTHADEQPPSSNPASNRLLELRARRMVDSGIELLEARQDERGVKILSSVPRMFPETQARFGTRVPAELHSWGGGLAAAREQVRQLHTAVRGGTRFQRTWRQARQLGWRDRLRLGLALVFPSLEYMRWRYQVDGLLNLLARYPYRWWVIMNDLLRTLVQRPGPTR